MSTPVVTAYSDTDITVSWTGLTSPANGNADVQGYVLLWNADILSAEPTTVLVDGTLQTSYAVSGGSLITPGSTYKFAVKARNVYGTAALASSSVTVIARSVPG